MRWIPPMNADRIASRARVVASLLGLLAITILVACRGGGRGPIRDAHGHDQPRRGGVLRTTLPAAISTLDPSVAYEEMAGYVVHHLYATLLTPRAAPSGSDTPIVPDLAESWSISPDGLVYAFTLRDGLRYSDGRAVVAGDFKYSLERVLTMPRSPFGSFLANIAGAGDLAEGKASSLAGVQVLDDRHLEIHLVEPDASFAMILTMSFTTPLARDHVAAMKNDLRTTPLGTGPFVLESWDESTALTLARNPHYWDPRLPYLDGIVFQTAVSREASFLLFEAGELDLVTRLSSADYLWLAERDDWRPYIDRVLLMNPIGARMNCQRPPFNDVRVRQALNYAVDKQHISRLWNGQVEISTGILPPSMFGHSPRLAPYPHDPARARQLLAEAGHPDGFSIEYLTFQEGPNEAVAQSLQADLAAVGVDMTIRLVSWTTLVPTFRRIDGAPFSFMGWQIDYADPSNLMDTLFHSRNIAEADSNNNSFYASPRLDALIDAARREPDVARRRHMYEEMDEFVHDEAPWIWLYNYGYTQVRQPYVMNNRPHPVWILDFREVWLDVAGDPSRSVR